MYHPDHHYQQETSEHDRSGRPCSWLYGVFVLNPNGKVSPCCASAGEETDFGDYSVKDGFFGVWNNATFRRARSLFKTTSGKSPTTNPDSLKAENHLVQIETKATAALLKNHESLAVDGMGGNLAKALSANELICHKCPIPWRQDDVHGIISEEASSLVRAYMEETAVPKRARLLLAYLLVGAPNWKTIARAKLGKLVAPLSLSFGRR